MLEKEPNMSMHIVSSLAKPIYPPKANHIIDAWCYSYYNKAIIVFISFLKIRYQKKKIFQTFCDFFIESRNKNKFYTNLFNHQIMIKSQLIAML